MRYIKRITVLFLSRQLLLTLTNVSAKNNVTNGGSSEPWCSCRLISYNKIVVTFITVRNGRKIKPTLFLLLLQSFSCYSLKSTSNEYFQRSPLLKSSLSEAKNRKLEIFVPVWFLCPLSNGLSTTFNLLR